MCQLTLTRSEAASDAAFENIHCILDTTVILRRSRDGHPEQAERVEGGRRGFAQDDFICTIAR